MGCVMGVSGCPCDNKIGDIKCALRIAAQKRRNNRHKRCVCTVWRPKCLRIRRRNRPCTCNNPQCNSKAIKICICDNAHCQNKSQMYNANQSHDSGSCPPNCLCKNPPAEPFDSGSKLTCPLECKCICSCTREASAIENHVSLPASSSVKLIGKTPVYPTSCLKPNFPCNAKHPTCLNGKKGNTNNPVLTSCNCGNSNRDQKGAPTPTPTPFECPPNCNCKCRCKKPTESANTRNIPKKSLTCPLTGAPNCKCSLKQSAGDSNLKSKLKNPTVTPNARENQTTSVQLRSRSPSPNDEDKKVKRFTIDAYFE